MVADVDALQGLYLRAIGPPLVALAAGALCVGATPRSCRPPRRCSRSGSWSAASPCPLVAGRLGRPREPPGGRARRAHRRARRAPCAARPSSSLYGAEERTLRPRPRRPTASSAALGRAGRARRRPRRRALDSRRRPDRGRRARRCRCTRTRPARSTACSSRCSRCSRSPRSRPSPGFRRPRGSSRRSLAAGRRVLELIDREPVVRDPAAPLASARGRRPRSRT